MIKHAIYVAIAAILAAVFLTFRAQALENIIRPYFSVRAVGMGNVRITTGLYDENFFGNPARVVENPTWKIQLPDPTFESTTQTIDAISDLLESSSDMLTKVGDQAGTNMHGRIQMTFPGVYASFGKYHWGLALITSSQFDISLRRSFRVDPQFITDIGPAFTIGRRLLGRDRLGIGVTTHLTWRASSKEQFSFVDLIQGDSISPLKSGADGAHIDFGIGAIYDLPWNWLGFNWQPGLSINNILDGRYTNLKGLKFLDNVNRPREQSRALNFGIAARRPSVWVFTDLVLAFEITDIGLNGDGSIYRLIHMGGETKFGILSFRAGINQGYPAFGAGVNLGVFEADAAYYGEEMSLNPGGLTDHRVALRLSFKI